MCRFDSDPGHHFKIRYCPIIRILLRLRLHLILLWLILRAVVECVAAVNHRRLILGKAPVLALMPA